MNSTVVNDHLDDADSRRSITDNFIVSKKDNDTKNPNVDLYDCVIPSFIDMEYDKEIEDKISATSKSISSETGVDATLDTSLYDNITVDINVPVETDYEKTIEDKSNATGKSISSEKDKLSMHNVKDDYDNSTLDTVVSENIAVDTDDYRNTDVDKSSATEDIIGSKYDTDDAIYSTMSNKNCAPYQAGTSSSSIPAAIESSVNISHPLIPPMVSNITTKKGPSRKYQIWWQEILNLAAKGLVNLECPENLAP